MTDALIVEQDGGVLTLTNNDAPRNRMTLESMDAVEAAAVMFTGEEIVKPGVLELADEARAASVGVAIASSSPFDWVDGHLRPLDIADRFGPSATLDDLGKERAKPHPDLFLLAAALIAAR